MPGAAADAALGERPLNGLLPGRDDHVLEKLRLASLTPAVGARLPGAVPQHHDGGVERPRLGLPRFVYGKRPVVMTGGFGLKAVVGASPLQQLGLVAAAEDARC